jgi:WD40 repeat protein
LGVEWYGANVHIYRASDGAPVRTIDADERGFIHQVQFSPDSSLLLTTSGYTHEVRIWRLSDGALLAAYDTETGWGPAPLLPARFHPDGKRFFIGRSDGPIVMAFNPVRMLTSSPGSFSVLRGSVSSGGLGSLLAADDERLVVGNGPAPSVGSPGVIVEFTAISAVPNPSQLQVKLESQVSIAFLEQNIELFDFVSGSFVSVDIRPGMLDDSVATGYVLTPSRFVQPGTNKIRARLSVRQKGRSFALGYKTGIDLVRFNIAP